MKNMLLASVAVLALMAVTPALSKGKDVITNQTGWKTAADSGDHKGNSTSGGGHHEQAAGTGGTSAGSGGSSGHQDHGSSGGSSGAGGISVRPSGIATGSHFRADSTGGNAMDTSGSHHKHGTGLSHQSGGDDNSGIIQHDTGKTANPLTGGSTMSGGIRGIGQDDSRTRSDRHNTSATDIFGTGGHGDKTGTDHGNKGGRHQDTLIIFGIGGHGYKNNSNFGHSRHNSAFDSFRKAVHSSHRYHDGTYHRPSGWYEHTWNYGDFLPALFFADRYQIDDYDDFDLSDPPDGAVWVRYGDDALLVDDDTGEIIQVVYGIFY